jgi:hypothetical protein
MALLQPIPKYAALSYRHIQQSLLDEYTTVRVAQLAFIELIFGATEDSMLHAIVQS